MRTVKSNQTAVQDSRLKGSSAELPIIQQGQNILIDARLLHQQLKIRRDFSTWIKARIEEFSFEPEKDFFSHVSPNRGNQKRGGDRRSIEVHLTLDMAKELAMLERNEIGRNIRRYFIQKEKEARGISQLPQESRIFGGIKPVRINGRELYPYKEILSRFGYSLKASSAGRRHRYPGHFVLQGNVLYVTYEFALHMYHQKRVVNNRVALKEMQPVLPLDFGDTAQLKPSSK